MCHFIFLTKYKKNMHVYYFQDLIMIKKNHHKIIQKEENWIENPINIIILLFFVNIKIKKNKKWQNFGQDSPCVLESHMT